jgi:hypothetical protein
MRQKVFIILALFYSVQFLISCCNNQTLEYTVTGVTTRTLILDTNNGFSFIEISDQQAIDKEDLIIDIQFGGTSIEVAGLLNEVGELGMQSAYAAIDCEDQTIVYNNRVQSVEITAIDVNNVETDVTNDLVIQGSQQSIADYINESFVISVFDGIVVEFNDVTNLSSQAVFRIRATLDDNTIVETTTNQVNFN